MMFKITLSVIAAAFLSSLTLGSIAPLAASAKESAPMMKKSAEPSIWEQLKLDTTQKKRLQVVRTRRTNAIAKVLNKDQKAKFDQLRGKQKLNVIINQLNLDANQKKAVMAANQQAQKEILEILTPAQRKQLKDYLNNNKQTAE